MNSKLIFLGIIGLFIIQTTTLSQSNNSVKVKEIVSSAIKVGDVSTLANYLNEPLDLTIPGSEDNFSKAQATQILKKFFKDNPPKNFVVQQSGKSVDGSLFVIGRYETLDGKKYKVYFLIKEFSGKALVYLLEIEVE